MPDVSERADPYSTSSRNFGKRHIFSDGTYGSGWWLSHSAGLGKAALATYEYEHTMVLFFGEGGGGGGGASGEEVIVRTTDVSVEEALPHLLAQLSSNNADHIKRDQIIYGGGGGGRVGSPMKAGAKSAPFRKTAPVKPKEATKGTGGAQLQSKTLWWGKGKERLDVENPNPAQRPGQIHYQDSRGKKYIYDPLSGDFPEAPNRVNKLLDDVTFKKAINKGLKYLGEIP